MLPLGRHRQTFWFLSKIRSACNFSRTAYIHDSCELTVKSAPKQNPHPPPTESAKVAANKPFSIRTIASVSEMWGGHSCPPDFSAVEAGLALRRSSGPVRFGFQQNLYVQPAESRPHVAVKRDKDKTDEWHYKTNAHRMQVRNMAHEWRGNRTANDGHDNQR